MPYSRRLHLLFTKETKMSKFLEMALAAYATVTAPRKDDRGATAVEYGLMVALIAIAIIAAVTLIGTELARLFNLVATELAAVV